MKILLYGINYAPELTGIGKYTAEMAEVLAAGSHDVRVVCAPPYYPEWRVAKGFSSSRYANETRNGVRIWRAPLWVPAQPKGAGRIAHLASFALSSFPLLLRHAFWRPDVVVCIAPSLMNAPTGWLVARLTGAYAWLHIQDYEVDAAFSLGMLKGSLLKRLALALERMLLRRFDTVSTISGKMVEHALRKGVEQSKVARFSNWADTEAIYPLGRRSRLRDELSIPDAATVVLYSGNMGAKQGLEVLAAAANGFAHRDDVVFVFCGNGPAREAITAICGNLRNCRFIDLQPLERLNELLNLADIHVLPQRADAADLVMPSKLTGMLASGRAVIAMANPGTELYEAVSPRGVVVPPGEAGLLVSAIEMLAGNAFERARLGRAGREFAQAVLSREAVLGEFEAKLCALRAGTSNS
ncbi:MAG: glycosyltransferase WbuB [Pseudomonadota bacterium]|jgi:colanic acid biosynthesis glycosyl transferase WcaI|uniref:glycosyltransferase WbuB n=1 Tax=Burkholderiaceae TaxID=119060 RepID=UPI0010F5B2A5|nr:glycosyltransferase WbuB [Burkholderia sp. 4M9327F10]